MVKRILDIVDAQGDFMKSDGKLYVPDAEPVIARIDGFLEKVQPGAFDFALFKLDTHFRKEYEQSPEADAFPLHCEYGTDGWKLCIDEDRLSGDIPRWYMTKNVFDMWADEPEKVKDVSTDATELKAYANLFHVTKDGQTITQPGTARDTFMDDNDVGADTEVVIAGVASDYCVHDAIRGYLKRGCKVVVLQDLTQGIGTDVEGRAKSGDILEVVQLEEFKKFTESGRLRVATSDDYLEQIKLKELNLDGPKPEDETAAKKKKAGEEDGLTIEVAQLNPTVGDIEGNVQKILAAWEKGKQNGAELVVTTELGVTGYPLEDLVEDPDLLEAAEEAVKYLAEKTKDGPGLIVGAPHVPTDDIYGQPTIYNAAFMLDGGEVTNVVHKKHLPNYGVFDEKRNFEGADKAELDVTEFRGHKLGLVICEDTWFPDVSEVMKQKGAEILLSINASPYEQGKLEKRVKDVVGNRARETGLDIIYVNQVGGQDELVFDGASFGLSSSPSGRLTKVFQAAAMREDSVTLNCVRRDGKLKIKPSTMEELPDPDEELWQALVLGTRDYVLKSGFEDIVIGMSGGIDSAVVAAIAVDALGPEHVHLVRLPSEYTSGESNDDAVEAARRLGVTDIRTIPIKDTFESLLEGLKPEFEGKPEDVAEENLQARARGTILMGLSNKHGWMLLTTGNKSEVAVGYCTLYGDTNGGFNPLKDVYKTSVYRLAAWRNENVPRDSLGPDTRNPDISAVGKSRDAMVMPWNIIEKKPSAELRPDQTDQDNLPPYEILDDILQRRIEGKQSRSKIISAGHDEATVDRVLKLMKIAVYKQNQAPPGVKTTSRAVRGKDLRLPIANRFDPGAADRIKKLKLGTDEEDKKPEPQPRNIIQLKQGK